MLDTSKERRLKVKSVFKNIDFCGSYGPKSTKKCIKSIFLKTDFTFNLHFSFFWGIKHKNLFFSDFFHQRVLPLVFENFDQKWVTTHKCQEKNINRFEISVKKAFICPMWKCSSMFLVRISCFGTTQMSSIINLLTKPREGLNFWSFTRLVERHDNF